MRVFHSFVDLRESHLTVLHRGYDTSESSGSETRTVLDTSITSAIIMPDDVAQEKVKALEALGAEVQRVRPASIVDKKQVHPMF